MGSARNILFIMCDQLRWDYLSCFGHPTIRTPNIDALARRGTISEELAAERERNHFGQMARDALGRN